MSPFSTREAYLPIRLMDVKKDIVSLKLFFWGSIGKQRVGFMTLSMPGGKENLTRLDIQFYSSLSLIFQRTLCFWKNLDCITNLIPGAPGLKASLYGCGGVVGLAREGPQPQKLYGLGSVLPNPEDSWAFWHMPRNLFQFMRGDSA